jgi:hypothetical protein
MDVNSLTRSQYTQLHTNAEYCKSAYAGSKGNISWSFLYRKQWANIEGAPSSFRFRDMEQ